MILKTEKLVNFLNFSSTNPTPKAEFSVAKFIQPINKIVFESTCLSINNKIRNFFFWENPSLNESFLAIDEFLKIDDTFSFDSTVLLSNQDEFDVVKIPDFIISEKFPVNRNDEIWSDYEFSHRFIPKVIFSKKNSDYFLTIFFDTRDSRTYTKIIEELQEYLNDLINISNKIFNNPTINVHYKTEYSEWERIIEHSLTKIRQKEINKVVLSRYISCNINSNWDLFGLSRKLINDYPDSYIFIYRRNNSIFLGVSPEKLITINNNFIETEALAGTIARGENDFEDHKLSEYLLNDNKELSEHKSVVDYIIKTLSEISTDIDYKDPVIKQLKYVQHLWTPIKAKLKPGYSIQSIIDKLHPTPAVCGDPKEKALGLIKNLENFDRGLFTGLLGWYNINGFGEIAVAIRSALIKNKKLLLFAGCGIVEGSTPEKEYAETELKLKSILSLFENETTN